MATTPDSDTPQEGIVKRVVALWTVQTRHAALAGLLGALVSLAPQPAAAIGALVVALVAFELGRKHR